jgi:RHH-type proline utilization regulon transcriptional repressor/proline dehydrogenase/delta 1-pyrroline-5-carboxylate dehydrogenase
VIRYRAKDLHRVIHQINATGYGLTLGIHSRIEAFANTVFDRTTVGNVYVNRNMVGAVVGVNPFGGHGLSGTGPKAGGPNYLFRFSTHHKRRQYPTSTYTVSGLELSNTESLNPAPHSVAAMSDDWHKTTLNDRQKIVTSADSCLQGTDIVNVAKNALETPTFMPGPTGEENKLLLNGRKQILLMVRETDCVVAARRQIATSLLCGCSLIIACHSDIRVTMQKVINQYVIAGLPAQTIVIEDLGNTRQLIKDPGTCAVLANSEGLDSQLLRQVIAQRDGKIIPLIQWPSTDEGYYFGWLLQFLNERTRTENLVAKGGNTQLFSLQETAHNL